jgi:hypothetical protein
MSKGSVTRATLLAVHLIFLVSVALAQTSPGDAEVAAGDVWTSPGERIYVPREDLELPRTIPSGDIEMATGDVWPSRKYQIESSQGALSEYPDPASASPQRDLQSPVAPRRQLCSNC